MNQFEHAMLKKLRELENLDELEARLVWQERKSRVILIVMTILAVLPFALLLAHIVAPSWLPLGH
jgi:hypothetical protein